MILKYFRIPNNTCSSNEIANNFGCNFKTMNNILETSKGDTKHPQSDKEAEIASTEYNYLGVPFTMPYRNISFHHIL